MKQRVRIFGAGVRASLVVDLIGWQFADMFEVEGFYDDFPAADGRGPAGLPILGSFAQGLAELPALASSGSTAAFIAAGTRTSAAGYRVLAALFESKVPVVSLVSPAAHVSPSASIGHNALVCPGVYIGTEVRIGHLFCAHGGTVIEHHSSVGDNVLMGPGCSIASACRVGSHVFLGAGSTLIPRVKIGEGTLLGAGSVVLGEIPPHSVAYGRPARPQRPIGQDDEVPSRDQIEQLPRLPALS